MTARATLELLRGISILAALDESQLERVAAAAAVASLPAGARLFHVGEEAHAAYVVASGRLEVIAEESETAVVRVLRRGDAVGELALLRGGRRSASIRAQRNSTLIALQRTQFDELLDRSPAFAIGLTRALGEQ